MRIKIGEVVRTVNTTEHTIESALKHGVLDNSTLVLPMAECISKVIVSKDSQFELSSLEKYNLHAETVFEK